MKDPIKIQKVFSTGRSQPKNCGLFISKETFFWVGVDWGKHFFLLFLPATPWSWSQTLNGLSSEVLPLKGSQPQRVFCFQNCRDTWTMLIRRRRPMALSRITEANFDFEIVENARVFVFQKFCGPPQSTSLIYKVYNCPLTSLFGARASKKISLLFFLV